MSESASDAEVLTAEDGMHLTLPVASTSVAVAFARINPEIRRPDFYRPEEDRDADTQPIGY
jgi:hypothetical protein